MQKVELADQLHFFAEGEKISLSCPGTDLPEDEGNLVFKAAQLFFKTIGRQPGIRIVLEKNIPVAAGLGGGSSDAAAAMAALWVVVLVIVAIPGSIVLWRLGGTKALRKAESAS